MSDLASEPERVSVDQVHAAVAARDMDRAIKLAGAAHAQGVREPLVLNLLAYQLELEDRIDEALAVLGEAQRLSPGDPFLLNSIGVCHSKAARPHDALRAFEAAIALDPDLAHAHNGRGLALAAMGDVEKAWQAQITAAELDPAFAEPLGALAALAAEQKDWAAARDLAGKALALDENQPAACMAMAASEQAAGEPAAVVARMDRLVAGGRLTKLHLATALQVKAEALDALDRPKEAMQAYQAANRELRPIQVGALKAELGLDTVERLIGYFQDAAAEDWTPVPDTERPDEEVGHVFLVGFARSGTTLLEQVLASHPGFVALEEKPTIDDTIIEFLGDAASLDRMAALDEDSARKWRALYWRRVREFGVDPAGKVFVDKLPMHTIYQPAVAKLFPRAKILLARRDPRDVVVSCFRKRFRPNRLVVEFTDLERSAQLYDATMRLAEIYRSKLALPRHIHRHEALIEDFDAETRAICDFVGVPWDPNMRNFVETANRRDIRTPSADQVRRGLSREGVGQWRRYGETIDVIQPILAPWVEAFGYPKD
ncbi:MAG: sulfotransferase [Phenylobacterium sp.]